MAAERVLLAEHTRRAMSLGVGVSEWREVSQRSAAEREIYLAAVGTPATSGGASSSSR